LYNLFKNIPKFEVQVSENKNSSNIKDKRVSKKEEKNVKIEIMPKSQIEDREKEKNYLKQIIKEKLEKKLKEKEEKKQVIKIKFPEDRPTFDISLLASPE
jgi:hypothetical protein